MQVSTEELPGGITKIVLDGRLDIAGAAAIDLKMNLIAGSAKKLLDRLAKSLLPWLHGFARPS